MVPWMQPQEVKHERTRADYAATAATHTRTPRLRLLVQQIGRPGMLPPRTAGRHQPSALVAVALGPFGDHTIRSQLDHVSLPLLVGVTGLSGFPALFAHGFSPILGNFARS